MLRCEAKPKSTTMWQVAKLCHLMWCHMYDYSDVIMSTMMSQITGVSIVYSTVCSRAHQIKHQSSVSLAYVRGIHRWLVHSPHEGPVTWKMFPFDDITMTQWPFKSSETSPLWLLVNLTLGNKLQKYTNFFEENVFANIVCKMTAIFVRPQCITHCGLVMPHKFGSTCAQVTAYCLTAPRHYLNQYWLIIKSSVALIWGEFHRKCSSYRYKDCLSQVWWFPCER